MVRNSVGEEAYVADELLRCRRGLAVRVGNTDAEGRMAMADLLAEVRPATPPRVFTTTRRFANGGSGRSLRPRSNKE